MRWTKIVVPAALLATLLATPLPANAQRRSGQGRVSGGGAVVQRGSVAPRGVYGGGVYAGGGRYYGGRYYGAPYRFYAPYYSFRPRFGLGFGLWVGYPVGYPYYYYSPYYGYYPYYSPYPYPYAYGYPYGYAYPYPPPTYNYNYQTPPQSSQGTTSATATGGMSFEITPNTAQIFVDGAYAGTVDDFTPSSQPLTLSPGRHHIEVRAPDYRTMTFDTDVVPGQVVPYRGTMERR